VTADHGNAEVNFDSDKNEKNSGIESTTPWTSNPNLNILLLIIIIYLTTYLY
jgi:hypothetical protein